MFKGSFKIQLIIILFIYYQTIIFAQKSKIRIDFADIITYVTESVGGFVVITKGEKEIIHVLDKKGKTTFQKEVKNNYSPFTQLLGNGKKLLIVTQGSEGFQGVGSALGTIELIDMQTKQSKWKHTATAGGFVVSPGNKYVASSDVAFGMKTDFVIINTESGELIDLYPILKHPMPFITEWVDSVRLVILTYQQQPNPKFNDYIIGYNKLISQLDSERTPIYESLLKLEQQVKEKNDEKSKKQFEAIRAQWGKKFEERIKKEKQFDQEHRVDKDIPAPAKIYIVNALTKKIENEKYLMNVEGTPIIISGQYDMSKILINNNGELIVEVQNVSTHERDIAKIDRNLITKSYATGSDAEHLLHKEFNNLLNVKKTTFNYNEKLLILSEEKQQ